jgi:hypothetical protein
MAKVNKLEAMTNSLPLEARAIQCITNFKPPHTSQDAVDQMAAEFATSSLLRTHAEKRYEAIKRTIVEGFPKSITEVRDWATSSMSKASADVVGNDWQINFVANRPAMRCDIDELRTELVKQGINIDVIDTAINKVSKKSQPATIITAKLVV